ncbi:MAG: YdcF family protein [Eubacteriales bacterium]|nr:YdcF family protein [Eubacteriales bacterium]
MLVSQITEKDLTRETIDRLLFQTPGDTGESADCIIVLGSEKAAKYRLPAAVEAYRAGRANKIMLCGGVLRNFPAGICTEAEHMRAAALEAGVPDEDILTENSSQNTIENILFALVELQRAFRLNNVRRVLLVTTAVHMRRSLAIARYLFPAHIAVIPCPANDQNTRRENWMLTPQGVERAKAEAMNIVRCVSNGLFPDFEI